ncbi:MAG: DUF523 domain-containing protein [Filifactoraceae bacterium]
MIVVSACLLGENCKYNGKNNKNQQVINFLAEKKYISICPEALGGLSVPRLPCEILDSKVVNNMGIDLTEEFKKGAEISLQICLKNKVKVAILKANSPSCSSNLIYDGSFSNKLVSGFGLTSKLLLENSIFVVDENNLDKIKENNRGNLNL